MGTKSEYTSERVRQIDILYEQTQRTLADTITVGQSTLIELESQSNTLSETEDTIESTDYIMEKSLKALRDMTWSGKLYNTLSIKSAGKPYFASFPSNLIASSTSSNKPKFDLESKTSQIDQSLTNIISHDDKQLLLISKAINELHKLGVATSEELRVQKESIDRIQSKSETVLDKTLEASVKASRITSQRAKPDFVGRFQFCTANLTHYLSTSDSSNLCLLPMSKYNHRSTMFDVYVKENNLFGLQSVKTMRFVGVTVLGSLKVAGDHYGRSEECYVNLSGRPTGLFIASTNWGAGGWLKNKDTTADNIELKSLTSSIYDKDDMILLMATPIPIDI